MIETGYTFGTRIEGGIADVRPRVEAALRNEGFGVLTEIDVAATLKARLGLERPAYIILGACNPTLAHSAIDVEPSIGALLPCNVVLREEEPGQTTIEILDPRAALSLAANPAIGPLAAEARERLRRVLTALGA